ncbi:biotin carboxylase N-terminal domain-containing protein [Novosphingobium sp. BL-8A]
MFEKVLIPNRGEIVRRAIKTARRPGIQAAAMELRVDEGEGERTA